MAIVNYYEKYGISQSDELEKIQWIINQRITDEENDSFGEGHSDKMFFLESAKEAFATAESRSKYDQDLADSMKKKDPDGERKAQFDKWYADAKKYYDTQQYDLAKSAIERASQYKSSESDNSQFYRYAAQIYSFVESYSQAIDYANQAIVLEPDIFKGYKVKSRVLERYLCSKKISIQELERVDLEKQLLKAVHLMCEKAIKANILDEASIGYGWLAFYHYYWNGCKDQIKAEEFAHLSISYGNISSDAKKVLDDITARRAKAAELKKQNADLQSKLRHDNERLQSEINSLKSSINNATTYGSTHYGTKFVWFSIIAGVAGIICFVTGAGVSGFVWIIGAIAIAAIRGGVVARNKNIQETLSQINQKESQLNSIKYNTESSINTNNNNISIQENGLAKQPYQPNADAQAIKIS